MLLVRNLLFSCILLGLFVPAFAINIRTTVPAVNHEGPHEVVGHISFEIDANEFQQASVDNPIYIRITLEASRGWSKTLVDLRPGAPAPTDQPIYLAVRPGSNFNLNPGIPASAVQLVRLIEGEQSCWLKFTDSSSDWIDTGVGFGPPNSNQRVEINLGIRGANSVFAGSNTMSEGNEWPDGTLISTLLCVNYRNTPQFGVGDLERADFLALDSSTFGVETGNNISLGNQVGIGFSNDTNVARGANYIPCFEYHFASNSFDAPPHTIPIGRLNQDDFKTYEAMVPDVYFTNSSDFPWEPGSRFLLVHKNFEIWYYLSGLNYPGGYRPEPPSTALKDHEVVIVPAGDEVWQLTPLYLDGILRGYDLLLLEGELGINETIALSGMKLSTDEDYLWNSLVLDAYAYYLNTIVTGSEPGELGPVTGSTAVLETSQAPIYRQVLPYTAYDRQNWSFEANIVNPNAEPAMVNALFYNRHGILLRILRDTALPPNASMDANIRVRYGDLAAEVLAWVEILSDKPLSSAAAIEDPILQTLDVFQAQDKVMETIYGLHIPTDDVTWDTRAYVLSADPDVDAAFFIKYPGEEQSLVDSFLFPGGTFVLDDVDFGNGSGRKSWLQVSSSDQVAVGLLTFFNGAQNASVNMNETPSSSWTFPHVGNPTAGWWNGAVVVNPRESSLQVNFQGLNDAGETVTSASRSIEAETRSVFLLTSLFDDFENVSQLRITGPQNFLSFLLLGQQASELLTAVPGNLDAASKQVLPYLPKRGDDWIGLALINSNPAAVSVSLTPYRADGSPGPSADVALAANDKQLLIVGDFWPDPSIYTHAVLEANGAVYAYALTGNAAGTQLATLPFQAVSP